MLLVVCFLFSDWARKDARVLNWVLVVTMKSFILSLSLAIFRNKSQSRLTLAIRKELRKHKPSYTDWAIFLDSLHGRQLSKKIGLNFPLGLKSWWQVLWIFEPAKSCHPCSITISSPASCHPGSPSDGFVFWTRTQSLVAVSNWSLNVFSSHFLFKTNHLTVCCGERC